MANKKMLIDATHPEETRVVVISGTRLEDFDVEVASRRQLKGNIYLAKVIRVEPSLQAAFVDYGGNRHGFLAFNEIHPDYYQIPVADREALIAEEEVAESEDDDARATGEEDVETVGGDDAEDVAVQRTSKWSRQYRIQEVIKRRQIILVQVVKEERGNKGAALTTYVSLAGRYCVLMPNTARGGGISRKIGSAGDRKRLKSIVGDMKITPGMAVIVRTAGANRTKAEIKRDYEYLLRLWENVRETTLQSTAPTLVHEEGNLIKRSIRDLYDRDIEEVLIEGEDGYRLAKDFMKLLIPSHAKNVKKYDETDTSLFHRHKVENQMDAMHSPVVQLRSGGYIVINPTEALVSVDVNSGRATRERNIEATALKTNVEAADEVARQLRLRDLAGLIVIDFIDMEVGRNNSQVERRLKEAMRADRARIQVGRISPFGLLEMSRQRLRPSLLETSFEPCIHCGGTGVRRSTESTALHVLRAIEEEGINRRDGEIVVHVPVAVALYILNQKRGALVSIESRYELSVLLEGDDTLIPPDFRIERAHQDGRERPRIASDAGEEDADKPGRRPRRRRRPEDDERVAAGVSSEDTGEEAVAEETVAEETATGTKSEAGGDDGADNDRGRRRRRGKRGGRRKSRRTVDATAADADGDVVNEDKTAADADAAPTPDDSAVIPFPSTGDDNSVTTDPEADSSAEPDAESSADRADVEAGDTPDAPPKRHRKSRSGPARRRPARPRAKAKKSDAGVEPGTPEGGEDAVAAAPVDVTTDNTPTSEPADEMPSRQPDTDAPVLAPAAKADAAPIAAVASTDLDGDTGKTTTINVGDKEEAPANSSRRGWWKQSGGD